MKVYVVYYNGCYEDDGIIEGIFSIKQKAIMYCRISGFSKKDYKIVEYEIDKEY